MKAYCWLLILCCGFTSVNAQAILTTIVDGPLSGGRPKFVEILITQNATDLSGWELRTYNNGNTSPDSDLALSGIYDAGAYVYLIRGTDSQAFQDYFELTPAQYNSLNTIVGPNQFSAPNVNGNDAITLYDGNNRVDIYGVVGQDGSGEPWDYADCYAQGQNSTPGNFNVANWSVGTNCLVGCTTNATCPTTIVLGGVSPLPITLHHFTATPKSNTTHLHWRTATELNNDYMAVEHSTDGRRYSEIGRVLGAGTTQQPQDYRFLHEAPAPGINYYRLRQVDYDGQYEYHGPVTARFGNAGGVLEVFPTATAGELTVSYQGQLDNDATLSIQSVPGRTLRQWAWDSKSGRRATFSVADLPSGWYVLRLRNGREVVSGRFLKQ
jgi:hypothetical protein